MRHQPFLFLCVVVCLAAGPCLWAAEEAVEGIRDEAPAAVDQETVAPRPAGPQLFMPSFESIVDAVVEEELMGCTAWYPCVHGGSVSCSAPTGTCTSSGQGCGLVNCNGNVTYCPGGCNTDWSCARFCYETYGSMDGYCPTTPSKCCVCL